MNLYEIQTEELKKYLDPRNGDMWKCKPITKVEIDKAIADGVIESRSWDGDNLVNSLPLSEAIESRSWDGDNLVNSLPLSEAREFHINRIATLFLQQLNEPLVLIAELHDPTDIRVYLYDGNHRLAAAYHRGDAIVTVKIATADVSDIPKYFPSAKQV